MSGASTPPKGKMTWAEAAEPAKGIIEQLLLKGHDGRTREAWAAEVAAWDRLLSRAKQTPQEPITDEGLAEIGLTATTMGEFAGGREPRVHRRRTGRG